MKAFRPRTRSLRTDATQRAELLAAFDRSGLSAAAFARQHQLNYTTFCGWRAQRAKAPGFVQVELPAASSANGLIVELGGLARLRIESPTQIQLAVQFIERLKNVRPC
jgi:hypothetical protein